MRLSKFKTGLIVSLSCTAFAVLVGAENYTKVKSYRLDRSMPPEASACIECHQKEHPGIFSDWASSRHASAGITCYDCHKAEPGDTDISTKHDKQYGKPDAPYAPSSLKVPVSGLVTPKDCSRCHPDEAKEYAVSKHANTVEIMWKVDPWLKQGLNSDTERNAGCNHCHGTVIGMKDGELDSDTWPNVGVGRVNPDGSKGSCTSCHSRHQFSIEEARKPEACGQCHLGPDHPQIEIYKESKHGDIYDATGQKFKWDSPPGMWTPGVDYRAPTCASCHMSGSGKIKTTHDVTERLSWELQTNMSIRPEEFQAFPAKTNWKEERSKMKEICQQCHGSTWVDAHYVKLDKVIDEYNNIYFKPAKETMDSLYSKGLLDSSKLFDESLETEFYELWHHEGRRARMGTAMMAPDYAWWHGFYECKKRFNLLMHEADELIKENRKAPKFDKFPNATGTTTPPVPIGKEVKNKK